MYSTYVKSLAKEYLDIIRKISSGMYYSETSWLEGERSVLHEQIENELDVTVPKHKMPEFCRNEIL